MSSIDVVNATSAVVSASGAIVAVAVAGWSIFEGRRLYKLQTSPEVISYVERNPRFHDAADWVVTNIGAAPAANVSFEWPTDHHLFADEQFQENNKRIFIVENGIKLFPPGQAFSFTVGLVRTMVLGEVPLKITYYRDNDKNKKHPFIANIVLRPEELVGQSEWTNREKEAQIAVKKALDKLRKGKIEIGVRPIE